MVGKKAPIAIAAVSGFLAVIVATSSGNWMNSSVHLVGPVYFSPQLALVAGLAFVVIYGILYAFVSHTAIGA